MSLSVFMFQNTDDSTEMYTIVSEIDKNGPADGKLDVGDWIRSVNRQPLLSGSQREVNYKQTATVAW